MSSSLGTVRPLKVHMPHTYDQKAFPCCAAVPAGRRDLSGVADADIIIRTRAAKQRGELLFNAIESVRSQSGARVRPIVVVNGDQRDPAIEATLEQLADVHVVTIADGPATARSVGRAAVTAPFFGFLDDDDELLPGAISAMLAGAGAGIDAVIAIPVIEGEADLHTRRAPVELMQSAPLQAMATGNWLTPGAFIMRSEKFSPAWFQDIPFYYEWTLIAYKLALSNKLVFIDQTSCFIRRNTPLSSSMTEGMLLAHDRLYLDLQRMPLPRDVSAGLRVRHARARNGIALAYLRNGQIFSATQWHLSTLMLKGGLKYLPFSRHIMRHSLIYILNIIRVT